MTNRQRIEDQLKETLGHFIHDDRDKFGFGVKDGDQEEGPPPPYTEFADRDFGFGDEPPIYPPPAYDEAPLGYDAVLDEILGQEDSEEFGFPDDTVEGARAQNLLQRQQEAPEEGRSGP